MSHENLSALSQESLGRMSPYALAERATAERAQQRHNTLEIEPLPVRGGTLHVVTSGIVAPNTGSFPHIEMDAEGSEIVRRQVSSSPLTAFADAVELRPPTRLRRGQALLYHLEQPLDPVLASTRGSFRSTLTGAMNPYKGSASGLLAPVRFDDGTEAMYDRPQRGGPGEPEVRFVNNALMYRRLPLSHDARSQVHLEQVEGQDQQGEGIGIRFSLSGLVRATLEPYDLARVTDNRVLAGPPEQTSVEFEVPPGTPQDLSVHKAGGAAAYARLQSSLDAEIMVGLLPDDAIEWADVTNSFLSSLTARIAEQLPLDAVDAYDQTVDRARKQIGETLLADRKPLIQSTGCLAVTARLAELPDTIEGMLFSRRGLERVT